MYPDLDSIVFRLGKEGEDPKMNTRSFKKVNIGLSVVIMLSLLLGACASATTAPAAPTTAPTQAAAPATSAPGNEPLPAAEIKVMGFQVPPEEVGTDLDKAYKKFLSDFQTANTNVKVTSLETPPDADNQMMVDLAAGTAPDVWQADASTFARVVDAGYILDMRKCQAVDPNLNLDRFFPSVLKIDQRADGSIFGLPNDFTPMMVYYNPESFQKAGVQVPQPGWTWDDLVKTAQALTVDKNGKHPTDAGFDANNIVTYGYRARKYTMEWLYRVWENGGDVLSPDGTTASGYLDSPATLEAIQFWKDLNWKYHVSPPPSTLDQMVSSLGFPDQMLTGKVVMYERGHWELVGIYASKNYDGKNVMVAPEPKKVNGATVLFASIFAVNATVEKDPAKLKAACAFVDAATSPAYQDTKAISGVAISANQASAQKAASESKQPDIEKAFLTQVPEGHLPYGAIYAKYPAIETILDSMMEKILSDENSDIKSIVAGAVTEVNRELSQK
jgi:multiple sugar transport system substrate-binding protein